MTIRELINYSQKRLSKISTSPFLDAEVLLSHVLDQPKEFLMTNPNHIPTKKQEQQFKILLTRRLNGEPVAYIRREKEFFGRKFHVNKNVLIPRPETEGLVELVLARSSNLKSPISILDIGTGSGNIIISLANALKSSLPPRSHLFFASDISSKALTVAKKNAKQHKVKITFKRGSLLEPWGKRRFDIIVANLPYLAKETDHSTKFEPKHALVAKNKGLKLYEELLQQIAVISTPLIFLEIGHDQGLAIKKLAVKLLPAYKTKIVKDLSLRPRYAVLELDQK